MVDHGISAVGKVENGASFCAAHNIRERGIDRRPEKRDIDQVDAPEVSDRSDSLRRDVVHVSKPNPCDQLWFYNLGKGVEGRVPKYGKPFPRFISFGLQCHLVGQYSE